MVKVASSRDKAPPDPPNSERERQRESVRERVRERKRETFKRRANVLNLLGVYIYIYNIY